MLIDSCKIEGNWSWSRTKNAAPVITTHLAKLKHVIIWIATVRTGNCRDK